ncbi:MAG: tRNA epoxyqueuosine(34) reductase QueG, partial [Parvibaculum sp.]
MPISTSDPASDQIALREALAARAREAGFDDIGFARADARPDLPEKLGRWLTLGRHGSMGWMEETSARRADPQTLWPEARSVIVLAMTYG